MFLTYLLRTLPFSALAVASLATAADLPVRPSAGEIIKTSQPSDWRPLDPDNTVYMDLPTGRVVIELAPQFAPLGIANIKTMIKERYFDGIASDRPQSYWWYGDLACLVVSAGPLLLPGVFAAAATAVSAARRTASTVLLLVGAIVVVVAAADASGMSKAEVERIWLPFVPWLTLSFVLLPERWRRWGLGAQVVAALVVQHLFYTAW